MIRFYLYNVILGAFTSYQYGFSVVHCRYQNDTRRKRQRCVRTRYGNLTILNRLAQNLERLLAELRQLIEKEHAMMRKCHLSRTRDAPTADHRHRRGRMMRTAEGPCRHKPRILAEQPRDAVYFRDLDGFSSFVSSGRIEGIRRASIVFPEPGTPTIRTLCPPAAAISSARFA